MVGRRSGGGSLGGRRRRRVRNRGRSSHGGNIYGGDIEKSDDRHRLSILQLLDSQFF
uniref:Uncharacterized protein n=1 Tax=Setaria viridis TaxID=4556 RepID=A0A4U6VZ13_SETVI|nr:hypothetical protein SEVIR_2G331401v2 [Setaria viridis]